MKAAGLANREPPRRLQERLPPLEVTDSKSQPPVDERRDLFLATKVGKWAQSGQEEVGVWVGNGVRSHTAADVLAGRESSRKCTVGWGTGGLGSIQNSPAPFQT